MVVAAQDVVTASWSLSREAQLLTTLPLGAQETTPLQVTEALASGSKVPTVQTRGLGPVKEGVVERTSKNVTQEGTASVTVTPVKVIPALGTTVKASSPSSLMYPLVRAMRPTAPGWRA